MPVGVYYRFKLSTIIQIAHKNSSYTCIISQKSAQLKVIAYFVVCFFFNKMLHVFHYNDWRKNTRERERERFSVPSSVTANLKNHSKSPIVITCLQYTKCWPYCDHNWQKYRINTYCLQQIKHICINYHNPLHGNEIK